jgi:hypothetical protein
MLPGETMARMQIRTSRFGLLLTAVGGLFLFACNEVRLRPTSEGGPNLRIVTYALIEVAVAYASLAS